jgi:hypothetical protein
MESLLPTVSSLRETCMSGLAKVCRRAIDAINGSVQEPLHKTILQNEGLFMLRSQRSVT